MKEEDSQIAETVLQFHIPLYETTLRRSGALVIIVITCLGIR
jgi:hypothetical protein